MKDTTTTHTVDEDQAAAVGRNVRRVLPNLAAEARQPEHRRPAPSAEPEPGGRSAVLQRRPPPQRWYRKNALGVWEEVHE